MKRRDAETPRKSKQDLQDLQDKKFSSSVFICADLWFHFIKISASRRLCVLIFLFAFSVSAQQTLPDEIRGYKVHKAKISVQTSGDKNQFKDEDLRVAVDFGEPQLVKVSPLGTTFEIYPEMTVFDQSGKIDFLAFRDFRVNGLRVEIEEYSEPFEIEKNRRLRLKKPVKILVGATQTIKGGIKEFFGAETEWQVTGRVFVFGKFNKLGFKFKRVVPVDVNLKIKNPLSDEN